MKKRMIMIFSGIMVITMLFGLFGTKKKTLKISDFIGSADKTMLVDSYEKTVGTPVETGYYELVLYTYSDTQLLLERYSEGGTDAEIVTRYLVPLAAGQEAFDAITGSGMPTWNGRPDNVGLNGKMYVCKFPDGQGSYIRVSSEDMPQDGRDAFYTVKSTLSAYLKEEYRIDN